MHSRHTIPLPGRPPLVLGQRALIMGILNVTPDSFSDGGTHDHVDAALAHARLLVAEGADIIDVGGESTRPGAEPVGIQQELDRVMPVLDAIRAAGLSVPVSIDTYKPLVADQAIQAGASIINDVHGLQGDPHMAQVAAVYQAPVIAMNWQRDRDPTRQLTQDMVDYFGQSMSIARSAGLGNELVIFDPGFGFGKSIAENYELLRDLRAHCPPDSPILVGTSRKSMIGKLLDVPADQRLAGTIATNVLGYANGGHIFRVHDVKAHRDALRVAEAALYGPPSNLG